MPIQKPSRDQVSAFVTALMGAHDIAERQSAMNSPIAYAHMAAVLPEGWDWGINDYCMTTLNDPRSVSDSTRRKVRDLGEYLMEIGASLVRDCDEAGAR